MRLVHRWYLEGGGSIESYLLAHGERNIVSEVVRRIKERRKRAEERASEPQAIILDVLKAIYILSRYTKEGW